MENKGLLLTNEYQTHPEGFYRFALNMVDDSTLEGSSNGSLVNEPSNELALEHPEGFDLIGHIPLLNDEILTFWTNNTDSEIAIFNSTNNTLTTLILSNCLAFQKCKFIKGEVRIVRGCERYISFYDGVNEDKLINLDSLQSYYSQDYIDYVAGGGTQTASQYDGWDCNKMLFNPYYSTPTIEYVETLSSGGSLRLGTYQIALELLDKDFNLIDFTLVSNPIPVMNESLGSSYYEIDGGYNIEQFNAESGGVPLSNYSIKYNFNNLVEPIAFIRPIVVRTTTGDGITKDVFKKPLISVTSDTISWTLSSIDVSTDIATTIEEITTPQARYNISQAQEQVDGRLLKANLKEKVRDWAVFQKYASKIGSNWVIRPKLAEDINQSSKSGTYYFDNRSYMSDEIYAFGIVFKFKDGTYSPALHIPGRPANQDCNERWTKTNTNFLADQSNIYNVDHYRNVVPTGENWDTQLLEVVDLLSDITDAETQVALINVSHLGFTSITDDIGYGIGLVPRWKVYNTALYQTTTIENGVEAFRGSMSYYESEETYPEVATCTIEDYWGIDCCGNIIVPNETKVRYHKFPDRTLFPHVSEGNPIYIFPIGIEFSNIQIPSEYVNEIDGYHIVRVTRDENNSTVLDKGISESNSEIVSQFNDAELWPLLSRNAKTHLNQEFLNGTYIKNDFEFRWDDVDISGTQYQILSEQNLLQLDFDNVLNQSSYSFTDGDCNHYFLAHSFQKIPNAISSPYYKTTTTNLHNLKIEDSKLIQPVSILNQCDEVVSFKINNAEMISSNNRNYFGLYSLNYANEDWATSITNQLYVGGVISAPGVIPLYYAIKRQITPYSSVLNLKYTHPSSIQRGTSCEIWTGDTFITRLTTEWGSCNYLGAGTENAKYIYSYYVESTINADLRHSGQGDCDKDYFKWFEGFANPTGVTDSQIIRYLERGDEAHFNTSGDGSCTRCQEFTDYNLDYSKENIENIFLPLPLTYEYCSECQGEYPNRIIWSDKSFEEDNANIWKTFKINNYLDISAHNGEVTNLHFDKNQLLIWTEQSLEIVSPNPQTMQASENNVYIGTGDFLSIPPVELIRKDFGYGGCKSRFAIVNTEFGLLWPDEVHRKVYSFSSQAGFKDLTLTLGNWFYTEGKFALLEAVPSFSCIDNTLVGVGYNATFDPTYKRYMLHKADYKPLYSVTLSDEYTTTGLYYYDNVFTFYDADEDTTTNAEFTNNQYFENKSWTLSYSFKIENWKSWHSYQPSYMFHNSNDFYTVLYDRIYKHNSSEYSGSFYNDEFPSIIEITKAGVQTQDLHSIHWYAKGLQFDSDENQWLDTNDTFKYVCVYTNDQSTGYLTLEVQDKLEYPFINLTYNPTIKQVIKTDEVYKLAQIRDLAVDRPVTTKNWNQLQNYYFSGQGYMDKDFINIDNTKPYWQLNDIKDKFINIRFVYFGNNKHVFDLIQTIQFLSRR